MKRIAKRLCVGVLASLLVLNIFSVGAIKTYAAERPIITVNDTINTTLNMSEVMPEIMIESGQYTVSNDADSVIKTSKPLGIDWLILSDSSDPNAFGPWEDGNYYVYGAFSIDEEEGELVPIPPISGKHYVWMVDIPINGEITAEMLSPDGYDMSLVINGKTFVVKPKVGNDGNAKGAYTFIDIGILNANGSFSGGDLDTHTHTYSGWLSDKTSHWKNCTASGCTDISGTKYQEASHTPGPAATATNAQTCTVCGYEINPATGGGASGKVDVPKNKEEGNFGAGGIANTIAEIRNAVLTKEDKDAMAEGKNINVWAEITKQEANKVKDAEKQKIMAKLPATFNVGAYLDIKLFKQMTGDDVPTSIEKTNGKVKIKFTVPKELQKGGRTYDIIRLHDGEATVLGVTREGYELTIETDGFSTYSLIYSDNPAVSTNANKAITSPKTGESSTPYAGMVLLIVSAFVFLTATKKREA